ncbi:transposase, IS4 [Rhodovulum sulfidophilum]|uniref:Transposase, IS4 n=1 Tax=Rhodovulum sulfidophilum TaxID=35806 RepID=A0A0D6B9A6_RHOSU|nr:transposase, IS4 [Rhodovulum sulfidophilum]
MSRATPPVYETENWSAYNDALKRRGSLTIWFDSEMVWTPPPTGKSGRQPDFSDAAIQTCLTMKVLFGMALRQATGFVESLLRLVGLTGRCRIAVPSAADRRRLRSTFRIVDRNALCTS